MTSSPVTLRSHLESLQQERAAAELNGLAGNRLYMAELLDELESTRAAFVAAAVTEIATLRGALSGRPQG